jgi:transcriptional regulator with XRE-family HTH domain
MPDHTMGDSVGDILRAERQRRRLSQAQAGALVGYSGSTLSRIERGERRLHIDELLRFADHYGITPAQLGLAAVGPQHNGDESANHVRRGLFLGSAARFTIPDYLLRRLDDALVALPAAPGPITAATVTGRLAASQSLFDRAQYPALITGLPDLLAAATELADTSTDPAAQGILAAGYNLATHTLNKIGQHPASRLTADRAMNHAGRAGCPLAVAMSSRALSVVLRHEGRTRLAQQVILDSIGAVEATGLATAGQRTVLAQTLCTAAYSVAAGGDRHSALELINDAERAVRGLGDRAGGIDGNAIARAQVRLYQVGVHWACGDSGHALDCARGLRPEQFPTAERRGRLHTDLARAWWQHGRPEQAAAALLAAYREAPTELTGRPSIRRIGVDLIDRHPHATGARELRIALRTHPDRHTT